MIATAYCDPCGRLVAQTAASFTPAHKAYGAQCDTTACVKCRQYAVCAKCDGTGLAPSAALECETCLGEGV